MSAEELEVLAAMTVALVELRQRECKHLSIENVAPEIFHELLRVYLRSGGTTQQREPSA